MGPLGRSHRFVLLGISRLLLGELHDAWVALSDARDSLRDAELLQAVMGGIDGMTLVLAYCSRTRAPQGYLIQAEALMSEALDIAQRGNHAPTLAWMLQASARTALLRGDVQQAIGGCRESLDLSQRIGFKIVVAASTHALGRALVAAGSYDEGVQLLREGYALWRSAEGKLHATEYAASAADACVEAGLTAVGREFIVAGEQLRAETEERYQDAELHRLRGRVCASEGADAEPHYVHALQVAAAQGARLFSLRAATDLAGLYQMQGRAAAGISVLRPIYEWFTEGFEYPDLVRAKSTLEALLSSK
jgi:tetratricopeptide (TPR) repeat protein